MGTLYVVATPIGNLEDITLRALRVLREVEVIAAEDTRTTRKLLAHYGISARLLSYNEHNQKARIPFLLQHLEENDLALVSDAGTPAVSDPGCVLVRVAAAGGHTVVSVPGPSAVTASIAAAGLPMGSFTFLGFLPRRSVDRHALLKSVSSEKRPIVSFETPHRLRRALADVLQVLGDRNVTVCRELTKMYEEVFYGTVAGALQHFQNPRGEFTLIIEEAPQSNEIHTTSDDVLLSAVTRLKSLGQSVREASTQVSSAYNVPRRRVYQLAIGKRAMTDSADADTADC